MFQVQVQLPEIVLSPNEPAGMWGMAGGDNVWEWGPGVEQPLKKQSHKLLAWLLWCRWGTGEGEGGMVLRSQQPQARVPGPVFVTSGLLFCKCGLEMTLLLIEVVVVCCTPDPASMFGQQHLHYIMVAREREGPSGFSECPSRRISDQWLGRLGFSFSPVAVTVGSDCEVTVGSRVGILAKVRLFLLRTVTLRALCCGQECFLPLSRIFLDGGTQQRRPELAGMWLFPS